MNYAQTDKQFETEAGMREWFIAAARKGLFDKHLECTLLMDPETYLRFADFARYDAEGKYHMGQYIITPRVHSKAGVIKDIHAEMAIPTMEPMMEPMMGRTR